MRAGFGAAPRRVIVSGMGLAGLLDTGKRAGHFRNILTHLGSFERGSPEWLAEAFLRTTKGDPVALLGILDTFVDTPREAIAAIDQPTLVLAGDEDGDNGSHERSEEHTSELQSLMRISYAVFCLNKQT